MPIQHPIPPTQTHLKLFSACVKQWGVSCSYFNLRFYGCFLFLFFVLLVKYNVTNKRWHGWTDVLHQLEFTEMALTRWTDSVILFTSFFITETVSALRRSRVDLKGKTTSGFRASRLCVNVWKGSGRLKRLASPPVKCLVCALCSPCSLLQAARCALRMSGPSLRACSSFTGLGPLRVWQGRRSASVLSTSIGSPPCTADPAARPGFPPICTQYLRERDPQHPGSLSHRWEFE